jgi:uncharacterized protein (TIGR03382 family)
VVVADVAVGLGWLLLAGWTLLWGWVLVSGPADLMSADGVSALGGPTGQLRGLLGNPALLVGSGLAALLILGQAGVLDSVEDGSGLVALDGPVLRTMIENRTGWLTGVATAVSDIGSTATMTVVLLVVIAWLGWRRRWLDATISAVALAGAGVLVSGLKALLDRSRPPILDRLVVETNASLPSGHALVAVVGLGLLVALALPAVRRRWARVLVVAGAAVMVVAICASRLYLGVHWFTDVIAGALLGGAWLAVCLTVRAVLAARMRKTIRSPSCG